MTERSESALRPEELDEMIERAAGRAPAAATPAALLRSLPRGIRPAPAVLAERLAALAKAGRLFAWPGGRYACEPVEAVARRGVLEALAHGAPLTAADAGKRLPAAAKKHAAAQLEALAREGLVRKHPRLGTKVRFGHGPADPADYLRPEVEKVLARLRKLGFSPEELLSGLVRLAEAAGQAAPPPAAVADVPAAIVAALHRLEPRAAQGVLVSLPRLRRELGASVSGSAFAEALLALARAGTLQLQIHDLPALLSEEDRSFLVSDGRGGLYFAAGLRME